MPELVPGLNSNLLAAAVVAVLAVVVVGFTRGRLSYERAERPTLPSTGTRQEGGAA